MNPRKPTTIIILLFPAFLSAHGLTICNYISDVASGQDQLSTLVYFSTQEKGINSNTFGTSSFALAKPHSIGNVYASLASPVAQKVYPEKNNSLHINLLSSSVELGEIEILTHSKSNDGKIDKDQISPIGIPITETKNLSIILGETDGLKLVQPIGMLDRFATMVEEPIKL